MIQYCPAFICNFPFLYKSMALLQVTKIGSLASVLIDGQTNDDSEWHSGQSSDYVLST